MKLEKKLLVPAITGKFANWRYYQILLKVENIAKNYGSSEMPIYHIKSVEEVEEIYSKKGVSNLLQRAYDPKRLNPIKNYILKQNDKYLNNLTIGIFGGKPNWINIDISTNDEDLEEDISELKKKFGFIQLDGSETLFVLDGQHRLKGLRKAFNESPNKIKDEEIVCTLIIHNPDSAGRIRTRRLFSTINRQAKPVSKGENILLDEDDVSSILVRELVEGYKYFKDEEVVALIKGGNISKGDYDKLTTVVTLWTINEKIIEKSKIYPKSDGKLIIIRPSDNQIKIQQKRVFSYWNKFFELFPSVKNFINETKTKRKVYREGGGIFLLRPIAQIAIFEVMILIGLENNLILNKLKRLPLNLNNDFWNYILWDPHKSNMLTNRGLIKNYIRYNIGMALNGRELTSLRNTYTKNSGDLELELQEPSYSY